MSGDLAVDRGVARDSGDGEDGEPVENEYKYVMVYLKEDESWLLSRLIYNTTD